MMIKTIFLLSRLLAACHMSGVYEVFFCLFFFFDYRPVQYKYIRQTTKFLSTNTARKKN